MFKKTLPKYSNEFYRLLSRLILDPTFRELINSIKATMPILKSTVRTGGFNIKDPEEYEVLESIDYSALASASANDIYKEIPPPNKIKPVDVLP